MNGPDEGSDFGRGQRLDKWLWHARFARTRSAAARLAEEGHVRVNGAHADTCARRVRTGDVLTIALERTVRIVRLRSFAARRGSATDAQLLYDIVSLDEPINENAEDARSAALVAPHGQSG